MSRKISIIGDSISTFEGFIPTINRCFFFKSNSRLTGVESVGDTWWMKVIEALGGEFLANASYSGSMVEGAGFPAGCSLERAKQVIGTAGTLPDDILVFYGINDYGWGGAKAQAEGRGTNVPVWMDLLDYPRNVAGIAPDDAIDLFECAYEGMLGNLKEVAPDASIHCISLLPGRIAGHEKSDFCYSLRGKSLDEYNEAIARATCSQGCDILDIRAYGYDYQSSDGTHPDKAGMQQIAVMVLAAIEDLDSPKQLGEHMGKESMASIFDLGALFPDAMRSERTCFEENCIGCEYAEDTGNKWSLVCGR